jgi:hypothetical protein
MQEPDIPQPEHFDKLCRQIGFAVMQAQLLEGSLARYLILHRRLNEGLAYDEVHRVLASADRKTIGSLLKQIEDKCPLPANLTDRLVQFCDDRNWLVHRLNREHPLAIFHRSEAELIFERINNVARAILEIMQDLDVVGDKMMSEQGIDPVELKKKALQYTLRKAGQLPIDDGLDSAKK